MIYSVFTALLHSEFLGLLTLFPGFVTLLPAFILALPFFIWPVVVLVSIVVVVLVVVLVATSFLHAIPDVGSLLQLSVNLKVCYL